MRIVFLSATAIAAMAGFAQTGKNQIGIGADLGIATQSGGGTAKYLYAIGTAGQLTFTTGAMFDSQTEDNGKVTATNIPLLAGYRHNCNALYVEPQLGYMTLKVTMKADGQKYLSGSDGAFAYGIGGGNTFDNGLDFGLRFRNAARRLRYAGNSCRL